MLYNNVCLRKVKFDLDNMKSKLADQGNVLVNTSEHLHAVKEAGITRLTNLNSSLQEKEALRVGMV